LLTLSAWHAVWVCNIGSRIDPCCQSLAVTQACFPYGNPVCVTLPR
jgi:hypothetical protein